MQIQHIRPGFPSECGLSLRHRPAKVMYSSCARASIVHIDASVSEGRDPTDHLPHTHAFLTRQTIPSATCHLPELWPRQRARNSPKDSARRGGCWRDVVALATLVRLRPRNDFVLLGMQPNRVGLHTRPRPPSLHHHAPYCAYSSGSPLCLDICLSSVCTPDQVQRLLQPIIHSTPSRTILAVSGLLRQASRQLSRNRESQHLHLLCSQQWPRHARLCRPRTLVRRHEAAGMQSYNSPSKAFCRCCRSTLRPCAFV